MNLLFTILNPYTGMYYAYNETWVSEPCDGILLYWMSEAQYVINLYHLDAVVELTSVLE